ncbi:MAG TPA: cytochrome P450 [Verrucomicrobiae bacterium]|nr:cytochrome P450 [Verrucomicrobiae bacterium]
MDTQALNLFSDEMRRNPYPVYEQLRNASPLLHVAPLDAWLVFDYEGVKRVISDHDAFTSRVGPEWLVFLDPPRHTRLRALIAKAFTPRVVANLEPRIQRLARELLDEKIERGEMDLATDFTIPLPMIVIAEMVGVPVEDRERFKQWSDVILALSYGFFKGEAEAKATSDFRATTVEMYEYVGRLMEERRKSARDDLLTKLVEAEVEGEKLSQGDVVAFVQLLLVGGQETTTNLVNNSILCFLQHPGELARLRANPALLPSAIEEVLRYRSPFQWTLRAPLRDVELHGQTIPRGKRVLAVLGSANHDPKHFNDPARFDIMRDPNPHIAFGHGIHFCLGAPLARLEAKVALSEILARLKNFRLPSAEPWEPRKALNVHGPARLPICFEPAKRAFSASHA